jgi:diguanylate cyclase (GGDEF)-like protein
MFKLPSLLNKERSLTKGTLLFVLLIGLSLGGLAAWGSWQERKQQLADAETTTTNIARALAQHAEGTILGTDNIVAGLVDMVERQNRFGMPQADLHRFMANRVAELPMLDSLSVLDQDGRPVASSQPMLAQGTNYADREYFDYHRRIADRGPHIGPVVRSRSTNDWVLTVSRRLNDADGGFAGVVVAGIKLDYFKFFYDEFDIGNDGVIILVTDGGTMLVRRPFLESAVGMDISHGPLFNEYHTMGPFGTTLMESMVDGTMRMYSYRHLENYPLLVAVALSKEEILKEWRAQTIRMALICAALFGLLAIFATYLILQIRLRQSTAHELHYAKRSLERLNGELETLASEDGLTGLSNRRKFDAALNQEFHRAVRNRSSLALIMIDVDRFKQFNDVYGHPAGDECLRQLGDVLKKVPSRASDMAARYGGEEMAVLLPDTDAPGAYVIAERIRAEVEALAIPHKANPGGVVTISAGVAAMRPTLQEPNALDLVQRADRALYAAKAKGRNNVSQEQA